MASYLPPGSPFFPPPPPHPTRFRQLYQPMIWQQTTSGNNTASTSPGVMVGIGIGVAAFLLLVILLCRYRNSRANAEAHAAAAAVAVRLQAPPQPDYWANDEQLHRRRSDDRDDDGRTQRTSPTAGLPSFTYNRAVRHNNVTGSGDEAATCSVCLGAFQAGETVRLLPLCLHLYHVECIDPWLEAHSTCPLCRSGTDDDPMMQGGMLPTV